MEDKDLGCLYVSLNPKAIAILSAIDAELVPETEEGFDDTQFQAFWVSFERRLSEHGMKIVKDRGAMFDQQREERTKENIEYLKLTVCALVGGLLASLVSYVVQLL